MKKEAVIRFGLVIFSLALFIMVMVVDLFSTHSGLLSGIKSDSDNSVYLLFNNDFFKHPFEIAGWQFAYPTYLLPLLIVNLLAGLFFSGFYVSVASTLIIAALFIICCFWTIRWIFKSIIPSKWEIILFVLILMSILGFNPAMLKSIPLAESHGGTVLLAVIFIGMILRYLSKPTLLSLIVISLFNIFALISDLLFAVSCTVPLAFALFIMNFRKKDQYYSYCIYALTLSTFIGGLSASYLRYLNFSTHAFIILTLASIIMGILLLPLFWMPAIIHFFQPFRKKIKIVFYIFFVIMLAALFFILYSQTAYHFIKILFDKRMHFGIAGAPEPNFNFFLVLKTMLANMLFGKPLSTTIWLKFYLLIPFLCIIYLIGSRYRFFETFISPDTGRIIALFLLFSVIIVFFANVFGGGLNTFLLPKNDFNIRYFLITIFLGLLIFGFILFHSLLPFFKNILVVIIGVGLIFSAYPEFKNINFAAYSDNNPYSTYMSTEIQCLLHYDKKYYLHYGLGDHFAAEAVNFFLPKHIYVNQIVLMTGKIWHVMNNIDWYIYNPNTKKIPFYNFILSNQPWDRYPALVKAYGKPNKIIDCGDQIYLGIYNTPSSLKKLNQAVYQQAFQSQAVKELLKKKIAQ